MLDQTKFDGVGIGATELEWFVLTNLERRLIGLYRKLSDQDRQEIRRLSELLAAHPEKLSIG